MSQRLAILRKTHAFGDFRKADLSGQDLDGWNLVRADLRGANLRGATGRNVDLTGANLNGAVLEDLTLDRWDLTGASLRDARLKNMTVSFEAEFVGVDLRGADLDGVEWRINGWRSRGILLPEFRPQNLSAAYDNNFAVARLLETEFSPDDFEVRQIIEFILSMRFPCWEGFRERMEGHFPHRIPDVLTAFGRYPTWLLVERWDLARVFCVCRDLVDLVALRESSHYKLFGDVVERRIKTGREKIRRAGVGG